MSNLDTTSTACGCCDDKPALPELYNPPGQTALNYRISQHSQFLRRMLGQINLIELPDGTYQGTRPLATLTTRAEDDFSIGILDCAAVVGDVLTFYQERIANEAYLRTATERFSILQLARAIGYELGAGVAAETYLAFSLDESDSTPESALIAPGTQVQSLPQKQGELPQTFETAEEFTGHAAWNSLRPRKEKPQSISLNSSAIHLKGTGLNLKRGQRMLLVEGSGAGTKYRRKIIAHVSEDRDFDSTQVTFEAASGGSSGSVTTSSGSDIAVHVLRQDTAIFGHNAPLYDSLPTDVKQPFNDWDDAGWDVWEDSIIGPVWYKDADLFLERQVDGLVKGGWLLLERPGAHALYLIDEVVPMSKSGFAMSSKVHGLNLSDVEGTPLKDNGSDKDESFLVRNTTAFLLSEELEAAASPITSDLQQGDLSIILSELVPDLVKDQAVIISGERVEPPGEPASELLIIEQVTNQSENTKLTFKQGLQNSYKRETVSINANVVRATHGETVEDEALGGGNGATPHQMFLLKKPPLTHVAAETPSGNEAELTVRVNGVVWKQVSTLYDLAPDAKSYIVRLDDTANAGAPKARIIFGDGKMGARLPTGQENVHATYRSGIGLAGEVGAGTLTLLKKRPFGVKGVTNPLAADGAEDPETFATAQANAPLTVKTLDRIVSLQDYEDFARAFAGIGKASAAALWDGTQELVHVTIADPTGGAVPGDQVDKLHTAMDAARDPRRELCIGGFETLLFNLEAGVLVDEAYLRDDVEAAISSALQLSYAFPERAFGQPVSSAEIIAAIQGIDGVIAVDLDALYMDGTAIKLNSLLIARTAQFNAGATATACGAVQLAELLLINPNGITLKEMAP